jgi:hypothetical protein
MHSFKGVVEMAHLILYENINFQGRSKEIRQSEQFLADFNDLASSFVIREGHWEFFTNANFQGQTGPGSLGPGTYPSVTAVGIPDSAISSVKLVSG